MANLSQPNDDGILLEVIAFFRSNFYGEHSQNRLDICRVNGYLYLGLLCASLQGRKRNVPWLSS